MKLRSFDYHKHKRRYYQRITIYIDGIAAISTIRLIADTNSKKHVIESQHSILLHYISWRDCY